MKEKISDFVNEVIRSHRLPGLAVGVVRDGLPYIEAGFGVRNLDTKEPVTANSLFHLASISKVFVATAVMQLVGQSRLSLTDPLEKYLPYIKIKNPFGGKVTIQHLLSHNSGFPDAIDYHWDVPEYDDEALERYVRSLEIELLSAPGERFFYSNIAFEVLGDLIAKVSQMPFEEYVKVNILQPLGMTSSTHFRENVPHNLTLTPHVSDLTTHMSEIYPYNRSHAPSSTLHSSAAEMNLWAMTNLNLGLLSHAAILRSSTYSEMWNPRMTVGEPGRSEKCVGLGWFIDVYRGLQTYYHSGQDVGFSTYFILIPERSVGVTILCNATPAPVEKIAFGILDILLGIEPGSIIPSVMIQLGKVYLEGGLEAMKARYADLKESYPREYDFGVDALLETSSALLDGNHNAQAIDILNFALELFPGHAGSYEMLARAYFQSEDMKQVMHYAQRSLEIEPNNPFLRQQMGMFGSTD